MRAGAAVGADYNPSAGDDVTLVTKLRITDTRNGSFAFDSGTASDLDLAVPVNCSTTVDPRTGSTCTVNTSADAVAPGAVKEGTNAVTSVFRARLRDSGSNGARGDSDDREFAMQGLYNP